MVRFAFEADCAFLMFCRAASRCFSVAMWSWRRRERASLPSRLTEHALLLGEIDGRRAFAAVLGGRFSDHRVDRMDPARHDVEHLTLDLQGAVDHQQWMPVQ